MDLEFVWLGRRCGDDLKRTVTINKMTLWVVLGAVIFFTLSSAIGDSGEMVWDGTQWVTPKPPQPGTPQGDLQIIRGCIADGQYKAATKAADRFLIQHTTSPVCEEAMNLAGQASIDRGRYWDAYKWYERQLAAYPNGAFFARALDREYKIGDAFMNGRKRRTMKFLKLSARDEGIDILLRIVAHAPRTEISERAMLRVADYHYDREEYIEAVESYDQFINDNRQSSRMSYAMLRAAKGTVLMYRGVEFDAAPLLDATVRFQVFAQAFPRLAEKENVHEILDEIHLQMGYKLYHAGTFYERTGHPVAARFYFKETIRKYPDTDWAQSAQDRLDILGPGESVIPMPLTSETKILPKSQREPVAIEDLDANEKVKPAKRITESHKSQREPVVIEDLGANEKTPPQKKRVTETPNPREVREISQPTEKKSALPKSTKPQKVKKSKPKVPEGPPPIPLEKLT